MQIYVIASSENGPSKIGIASDSKKRLKALQTGNHSPLKLYFFDPIGPQAGFIERAIHKMLARRSLGGGKEWFDVTPSEAENLVRYASKLLGFTHQLMRTPKEIHDQMVRYWLQEQRRLRYLYEKELEDDEERDEDELDAKIEKIPFPDTMQLIAAGTAAPEKCDVPFRDYLLTFEDGMWLRWAFERMNKRMPLSNNLAPFLKADDWLESRGTKFGRDVAIRWLAWTRTRALTRTELSVLADTWNKFASQHNLIVKHGPQRATHGIDDYVNDVHLMTMSGSTLHSDRDFVIFRHSDFRAVINLGKGTQVHHLELQPIRQVPESGFVSAELPKEYWTTAIFAWLENALHSRDASLQAFVENPDKKFPQQRPYDESQGATYVWDQLSSIAEDGTF